MSQRSSSSVLNAVHRLYGAGEFAQALDALRRVPHALREGREGLLLRGACLARLGLVDPAAEAFEALLTEDPDCHEALTWMAILRKGPDRVAEALGYAQRAIALRPDEATGYGTLGAVYLAAGSPEEASQALRQAVDRAPEVAEHRHNLALALLAQHRHDEAIEEFRRAIKLSPHSPQNYLVLASTYSLFGMTGEAIECLMQGLRNRPDFAPLHSALAGAYAAIRNDEASERHHRRALELSPEGRNGFATWLQNQGRFEEANAIFDAVRREATDPGFAYYGLMQSRKLGDSPADDRFVLEMKSALGRPDLRPRGAMYLRYALGRAAEQRHRYEEAMAHFDEANRLANAIYHAGPPLAPHRFAEENVQAQSLATAPVEDGPDAAPIFIVGMIRSGTTLLDQIVSSHPAVASGGELRFWIEEGRRLALRSAPPTSQELRRLADEYVAYSHLLAGPAARLTDKMPLNFAYIGLIRSALPNARFLHIRRNPVDIALSIWTTFFGQGPLFAYDKANIVAYYRAYEQAMDHWRSALPAGFLLELDYEILIADPEPTIRRVIDFVGLPWDDACLRHSENRSAINTPSRWQARQPIYKSSVERWRRYEPWLGPFSELLA
ncbi:MAG: sulfotransferase [Fimbriimonas sp.]